MALFATLQATFSIASTRLLVPLLHRQTPIYNSFFLVPVIPFLVKLITNLSFFTSLLSLRHFGRSPQSFTLLENLHIRTNISTCTCASYANMQTTLALQQLLPSSFAVKHCNCHLQTLSPQSCLFE